MILNLCWLYPGEVGSADDPAILRELFSEPTHAHYRVVEQCFSHAPAGQLFFFLNLCEVRQSDQGQFDGKTLVFTAPELQIGFITNFQGTIKKFFR